MTESNNVFERTWTDHKGRKVLIHTMSNRWLNNIRKMYNGTSRDKIKPIMDEIKRRKKLRQKLN
jgi:hypothetical protein